MPANTFPFAVFVGRQNKLANFLQRIFEFGDQFFSVRTDHIERIKVIFDVYAQSGPGFLFEFCRDFLGTGGKIADVAHAGLNDVIVAQKACNFLGFRGRFDDHECFFLGCHERLTLVSKLDRNSRLREA